MKNLYIKLLFVSLLFSVFSCVDLDETSFSKETSETAFENEADVISGLTVVYNSLTKGVYYNNGRGGVYDVPSIGMQTQGTHLGYRKNNETSNNTYLPTAENTEKMYLGCYFGIAKANLLLAKVNAMNGDDYVISMEDEVRTQVIAETRFLRGLFYLNLVQYYGDVPIIEEIVDFTDYDSSLQPRNPKEEVFEFLLEDFHFAEENLEPANFNDSSHLGRATKGAVQGLLARTYLYMAGYPLQKGDSHYQLAYDYAKKVEDSGVYDLLEDYTQLFFVNSERDNEWLFAAQFGASEELSGNWGGWQTLSYRESRVGDGIEPFKDGYGRQVASEELVLSYDETDPRFIYNINTLTNTGKPEKTKNYWKLAVKKFRSDIPFLRRNATEMNAPIMRYADILLILAETENELNGPTQTAVDYVNMVRARARSGSDFHQIEASESPADLEASLSQDELREIIFWDRARELCWESTDRMDLVRSGNFVDLINAATHVKKSKFTKAKAHNIFFPLPQVAVRNNPLLIQTSPY